MAREKATIIFRGRPLWQTSLETLSELRPDKIYISARAECDWRPADTELLLDSPPSRGPMSGIGATLSRMETSHLIALAVDMPFVPAAKLKSLCKKAKAGCGVVPVLGERFEPLAAVYPVEARELFVAALAGVDWSLQRLIRQLAERGMVDLVSIAPADASGFRSVNEPADLPAR